jgi:transposase
VARSAIVAVGRSILVIVWALLSDDNAHFVDLGPYCEDIGTDLIARSAPHVRELQALGSTVTLSPAA